MIVEERLLSSVQSVYAFIAEMQNITGTVLVEQGPYIVNGKSIMGIFSLDLMKPVTVKIGV
jgi:hypothetical protein